LRVGSASGVAAFIRCHVVQHQRQRVAQIIGQGGANVLRQILGLCAMAGQTKRKPEQTVLLALQQGRESTRIATRARLLSPVFISITYV